MEWRIFIFKLCVFNIILKEGIGVFWEVDDYRCGLENVLDGFGIFCYSWK